MARWVGQRGREDQRHSDFIFFKLCWPNSLLFLSNHDAQQINIMFFWINPEAWRHKRSFFVPGSWPNICKSSSDQDVEYSFFFSPKLFVIYYYIYIDIVAEFLARSCVYAYEMSVCVGVHLGSDLVSLCHLHFWCIEMVGIVSGWSMSRVWMTII
jgi:hypothetical protein